MALRSTRFGLRVPPARVPADDTFARMSSSGNGHRRFVRPDGELRRLTTLGQLWRNDHATEDDVLAATLTTLAGALPGHAVAIATTDDDDVRIPDRLVRGRMPIETATLLAALALDRSEAVERPEGDGAVLAFPLTGSRGPMGALVASANRAAFADADRAMLQVTARQLALTLENLRLRRSLDRLLFRTEHG